MTIGQAGLKIVERIACRTFYVNQVYRNSGEQGPAAQATVRALVENWWQTHLAKGDMAEIRWHKSSAFAYSWV